MQCISTLPAITIAVSATAGCHMYTINPNTAIHLDVNSITQKTYRLRAAAAAVCLCFCLCRIALQHRIHRLPTYLPPPHRGPPPPPSYLISN